MKLLSVGKIFLLVHWCEKYYFVVFILNCNFFLIVIGLFSLVIEFLSVSIIETVILYHLFYLIDQLNMYMLFVFLLSPSVSLKSFFVRFCHLYYFMFKQWDWKKIFPFFYNHSSHMIHKLFNFFRFWIFLCNQSSFLFFLKMF